MQHLPFPVKRHHGSAPYSPHLLKLCLLYTSLKALRCINLAGSASISVIAAFSASGMYIISIKVPCLMAVSYTHLDILSDSRFQQFGLC